MINGTRVARTLRCTVRAYRKRVSILLAGALAIALLGSSQPAAAGLSDASTPEATCPAGGQCFADVLPGSTFYDYANNLFKQDIISGYACGGAGEPCDSENRPYYRPGNSVTRAQMTKFVDLARTLPGININTATYLFPLQSRTTAGSGIGIIGIGDSGTGVFALSTSGTGLMAQSTSGAGIRVLSGSGPALVAQSTSGIAVRGISSTEHGGYFTNTGSAHAGVFGVNNGAGEGARGHSESGQGVRGTSNTGIGVLGFSPNGVGVHGESTNRDGMIGKGNNAFFAGVAGTHSSTGPGIYGESSGGWAGYFAGNIRVTGSCTGCAGPSKIDHPLDPANKYLSHSSVESPDMMNIYNGNVTTDAKGEAVVEMPAWFEALNKEFRYQLTAIGAPGPNLYVAEEIKNNRFKIAGGTAGMKVSWQVTGVQHDPYSEQQRTPVETDKPDAEKGLYLHPEAYGQPESKQIGPKSRLQDSGGTDERTLQP